MINGNEMKAFYRIMFPKRDGEGGLTARVPDVNETRLNDNFKTIGDEFRKIWEFIKNGFKTKSLTVDGDASVGGQLSAGSADLGDTNVNGALDVDGSATFDSGVTIGGVLDLAPRRCSASLSSAGWYRVLTVTGQGRAGRSWMAELCITRTYGNANNEIHSVKLMAVYDSFAFTGENSKTNTLGVDKIRYTRNGSTGYIDLHYSLSNENLVAVDFNVHVRQDTQTSFAANSLESVAASPSGETVLTEYSLSANTEGNVTSSFSSSKGTFRAFRCGKMVTVTFLGNSTTWTTDEVVGTIGSDVIPALSYIDVVGYIGRQAVVVRLNQTGNITLWIGSTLTGNQRLYFSFTYPIL
jgi:hypothetical protein